MENLVDDEGVVPGAAAPPPRTETSAQAQKSREPDLTTPQIIIRTEGQFSNTDKSKRKSRSERL
jgi:hypothetical protein